MTKKSELTPAEWEIMEGVWQLEPPVSVRDVLEHLYPDGAKAYTTVQTVMNVLEKKKLLSRRKTGLVNFYTPTRSREQATRGEMLRIVERVFQGSIPALANSLMSLDDLEQADIDEIRRLLAERESQLKGVGDDRAAE